MPSLEDVLNATVDITVMMGPEGDVPVELTYDPNAYTPEAEAEWAKLDQQGWAGQLAADFICRIIKSWNLQENDTKKVIKLDPERVAQMPMTILSAIMDGVLGDVQGKAPRQERRAHAKKKRS